jgi:hypothetical protein
MKHAMLFAFLTLFAAACQQGLGQRCQVSSDCKHGLYCVLPVGATPASGGTCQTAAGPDMSTDMPVVIDDLSQDDIEPTMHDLSTPPDQSPND